MSKKIKKIKKNIVIVCEGTETENQYFNKLKKLYSTELWSDIKIVPEPNNKTIVPANSKRPKKKFNGGNKEEYRYITQEDSPENYKLYKSQPTKYVREAQLYLENEGYSDAWAVFDKDQHPDHAKAFNLANETGVNIAFSSLAFETWILAHFEKTTLNFEKVECKVDNTPIGCGINGIACIDNVQCLCGYIRNTHYPEYAKSNNNIFEFLQDKLDYAYENASWLRFKYNVKPIYLNNIYTDVDGLVKDLLGYTKIIEWIDYNSPFKFESSTLNISYSEGIISINNSGKTSVILDNNIYFSNDYGTDVEPISRITISPGNSEKINHSIRRYLNLKTESKLYIIEIPPKFV